MQVSATASDTTSGVGLLESSLDGGVYQAYYSPVSFADGYHTVQFKAVDKAGNETETSVQEFYVDTIAPAVDLLPEWEVNDTITYKVQDDGSGLSALRIVIEDEDEKFAKVAWDEMVSGNKFKGEIIWNGKFRDGTVAPPGEYLVWVKTTDVAGNERIALGRVIVPSLFSLFPSSKSSTEILTPPADLFVSKGSSPTTENLNPVPSPSTNFGGSTTPTNSTSVQSLTLTSGTASAPTTTSSNVLWGATAAALIGWATATALDERKKRKEQEQAQTQISEVSLQREKAKARASRDEEPPLTRQEKELAKQRKELQKLWDANGAAIYEANREYKAKHGKEMDGAARSKAIKDATRNGVFNAGAYASNLEAEKTRRDAQNERMANKMTRFEKEEEVRWLAQQKAAEEKKKAADLQAGYAAYYAATRQGQREAKSNWWERTKSFVQEKIIEPVQEAVNTITMFVNGKITQPYIKPALTAIDEKVYQPFIEPTVEKLKPILNPKTITTVILTVSLGETLATVSNVVNNPHVFDEVRANTQAEWMQVTLNHPELLADQKTKFQYLFSNPYEAFSAGYDVTKVLADSVAGYLDVVWQQHPLTQIASSELKQLGDNCPEQFRGGMVPAMFCRILLWVQSGRTSCRHNCWDWNCPNRRSSCRGDQDRRISLGAWQPSAHILRPFLFHAGTWIWRRDYRIYQQPDSSGRSIDL